jgi:hypothetical protein
MGIESNGHSQGNPRLYDLYELIEHAPKSGKSPTVWAWPRDHRLAQNRQPAGAWAVATAPGAAARPRGGDSSRGGCRAQTQRAGRQP